jgi:lipopolysaccharide export LptBFGC system permease protein LptF
MIKDNVKQILFRSIQRKGYYIMPGDKYRIYADQVDNSDDTLKGVVIVKIDGSEISKIITAETAKIVIDKKGKQNRVRITASEFYQLDETGQAYSSKLPIEETFPPILPDDIKFQKMEEIQKIKADMTYFNPVREIALECRAQLAVEMLVEDISRTIANPNEDENYYRLENQDREIAFTAAGCELSGERNIRLMPPIQLIEFDKIRNKLRVKWASNQKATIKLEEPDPFYGFVVVLENSSWERAGGTKSIAPAPKRVFRDMELPKTIVDKLGVGSVMDQIYAIGTERSELKSEPSGYLNALKKKLQNEIWLTKKDINSEIHSRLVFGLGCIVLILIAIALGIIFRGGHLLSAFGASAIPAGILIIFLMSGKELAKTYNKNMPDQIGIMVMWSGLVILSLLAALIYRKLTRT